jgi:hypothetical protein
MSPARSRAGTPHQSAYPDAASGAGRLAAEAWGGGRKMATGTGGKPGRSSEDRAEDEAVERVCGMGVWAVVR